MTNTLAAWKSVLFASMIEDVIALEETNFYRPESLSDLLDGVDYMSKPSRHSGMDFDLADESDGSDQPEEIDRGVVVTDSDSEAESSATGRLIEESKMGLSLETGNTIFRILDNCIKYRLHTVARSVGFLIFNDRDGSNFVQVFKEELSKGTKKALMIKGVTVPSFLESYLHGFNDAQGMTTRSI